MNIFHGSRDDALQHSGEDEGAIGGRGELIRLDVVVHVNHVEGDPFITLSQPQHFIY